MKNKNFIASLLNSINGLLYVIRHERNFRIQLSFTLLVVMFSYFYQFSIFESFALYFAVFIVLLMECINTCFERVVDLYTMEYHPLAKYIKDVSSACVLISSVFSFVVGVLLFFRVSVLSQMVVFFKDNPILIVALIAILLMFLKFITLWKD